MQEAIDMVWRWCILDGLNVMPNKTVIESFSRRTKLLFRAVVPVFKVSKYLEVILDQKLPWHQRILSTS